MPIFFTFDDIFTKESFLQLLNALSFIEVTFLLIVTSLSFLFPANAFLPIDVTLYLTPLYVTFLGIAIFVAFEALLPIYSTFAFVPVFITLYTAFVLLLVNAVPFFTFLPESLLLSWLLLLYHQSGSRDVGKYPISGQASVQERHSRLRGGKHERILCHSGI